MKTPERHQRQEFAVPIRAHQRRLESKAPGQPLPRRCSRQGETHLFAPKPSFLPLPGIGLTGSGKMMVRPSSSDPMRIDLSDRLIHLSKATTKESTTPRMDALENLISILTEKRLRGASGMIKGKYNCVCFSEAPIATLTHLLARPGQSGYKYQPYGITVEKQWLFEKGGRPVIYATDSEYVHLDPSLQYRFVKFDLRGPAPVDFTWEREWRILTEGLPIAPEEVTVVVPTRDAKEAIETHLGQVGHAAPWHFLVLSDLGVPIEPLDI
ncbi:hypothetical protein [Paraburkholderia domus]|nr:hypothetical protein [Paraburkholderia domus]MBK5170010.1 hypothetical protein [Burkholderia sp. R-70211]